MNRALFLFLLAATTPLLAEEPPAPKVTKENVFTFYKDLPRLAKEPYEVPWRIFIPCAVLGSSGPPRLTAEEEAQKYGPHNAARVQAYGNKVVQTAVNDSFRYAAASGSHPEARVSTLNAKPFPPFKGFPVGAMIVKEKLGVDDSVTGVGAMIKRAAGYDPENGDWEYVYAEKGGRFVSGRRTQCGDCHLKAKDADFVFGGWLGRY